MKKNNYKQSLVGGFTLIELLIVIAVMAILTTVVFVALNPLARFQDSRNSRRWSDVNAILGAIKLHQVDNGGAYLDSISTNAMTDGAGNAINFMVSTKDEVTFTGSICGNATILDNAVIDVKELVDRGYLPKLPFDPNDTNVLEADGDVDISMYYLRVETNNAITVGACTPEQGSQTEVKPIEVTR